jgi:hypothetical protein
MPAREDGRVIPTLQNRVSTLREDLHTHAKRWGWGFGAGAGWERGRSGSQNAGQQSREAYQ